MLLYVIMGVFAAVGVLFLLWLLLGACLTGCRRTTVAIYCREQDLLALLRRYRWLRELGLVHTSLVILDSALCREARQSITQTYPGVTFCTTQQWLLERGSEEIG